GSSQNNTRAIPSVTFMYDFKCMCPLSSTQTLSSESENKLGPGPNRTSLEVRTSQSYPENFMILSVCTIGNSSRSLEEEQESSNRVAMNNILKLLKSNFITIIEYLSSLLYLLIPHLFYP